MTDKATLRKDLAARRAVAFQQVDQGPAQDRLLALLENRPGPVSFYWPIRSEIDPRPVIHALVGQVPLCLPITHGRGSPLSFHHWAPDVAMTVDGFKVPIPENSPELVPKTLIVPMLGFDSNGHRLGYGAGHYDRTLEKLRAAGVVTAIGFAFEAQYAGAELPTEPTDQPLDFLVTEAELRRFGD